MSNPLIPVTIDGLFQWTEDHLPLWSAAIAGALDINLSAADITAGEAALAAAEAARTSATTLRSQAKTATAVQDDVVDTLRSLMGVYVNQIRAAAQVATDPNEIYTATAIPPRAEPTPAPAPTPPTAVTAAIDNDGNVIVKWKATKTNGDFWSVWRQMPGEAAPTMIGTLGGKTFLDTTVPSAAAWATYRVKSHRGTEASESSEPVQVLFGTVAAAA